MDTRFSLDENFTVEDVTLADIKIQKIYLERTRVYMIAQASIYMFFFYILVGMIGLIKGFFDISQFMLMLLMGIAILFIASYPYVKSLNDENSFLDTLEERIKSKGKKHSTLKYERRHIHRHN